MMNKFKNFFLLTVCAAVLFGAACGVSAQSAGADKILAAGKQPLKQSEVNKIIEFYEWAFEARFTPDERRRFAELSAESYRQDPATARKDSDTLINALAAIRAKSASDQARVRESFNENFAKDLRAGTDELSRLLLAVYERGQNGGNNGETIKEVLPSEEDLRGTDEDAPASSSGGGSIPKNLVGRWFRSGGAGGSRGYTGDTKYNSGNDVIFEFRADGTMQFINDKNTLSITQCRITEMMKIPGTYRANGGTLTMNLSAGTHVGTSSCERAGNFKKTVSPSTLTKKFVVKNLESVFRPDAPLILCLDGAKDEDCFELANK